jgi:hypothetical protein
LARHRRRQGKGERDWQSVEGSTDKALQGGTKICGLGRVCVNAWQCVVGGGRARVFAGARKRGAWVRRRLSWCRSGWGGKWRLNGVGVGWCLDSASWSDTRRAPPAGDGGAQAASRSMTESGKGDSAQLGESVHGACTDSGGERPPQQGCGGGRARTFFLALTLAPFAMRRSAAAGCFKFTA